jgi:hypothetical protein
MWTLKMHQPKTDLASEIEQEEINPSPLNDDVFSLLSHFVMQYEDMNDNE